MLELKVYTGEGEFIYTSDQGILRYDHTITQQLNGNEIEVGDVSIHIGGAFLGALARSELPAVSVPPRLASGPAGGGYRAVLLKDGLAVLNGVIPRADLARDHSELVWDVLLAAGSSDDLWTRLEKVRLGDMRQATVDSLAFYSIPSFVREAPFGGIRYMPGGSHRWYTVRSLVQAVIKEASYHGVTPDTVTLEGPVPDIRYSVRYLIDHDDGITLTRSVEPVISATGLFDEAAGYSRRSLTLPDWNGSQLLKAILDTFGWRLAVRYAEYPSTDLVVQILTDDWSDPSPESLPDITERVSLGGYTERMDRARGGSFALRLSGPQRPVSPQIRPPQVVTDPTVEGRPQLGAIPSVYPPHAILAPDEWSFEPAARQSEPDSSMEDVVTIPFMPPEIVVTDVQENPPIWGHEQYRETIYDGCPVMDTGGPWLATYQFGRLVLFSQIHEPAPGQDRQVNPLWASGLYGQRQLSRSAMEVIEGDFRLHGLESIGVGVEARGVCIAGTSYLVREMRRQLETDVVYLEAVRPAASIRPPARPSFTGTVQNLQVSRHVTSVFGGGLHDTLMVTWEPPLIERSDVQRYDVQIQDSSPGTWYEPPGADGPAFATARLIPHNRFTLGNARVRVRAVGQSIGPWVEIDEVPE